jgi:stalled ribosome rescue protein Dom34
MSVRQKTINIASGQAFRLVHDGTKVISLIEGTDNDKTTSEHTIVEFQTEQEAIGFIQAEGLEYEVPEKTL